MDMFYALEMVATSKRRSTNTVHIFPTRESRDAWARRTMKKKPVDGPAITRKTLTAQDAESLLKKDTYNNAVTHSFMKQEEGKSRR